MDERKRNVAVGATLIVALAGLALLILMFGELPDWLSDGYEIHIPFPSAGGVDAGSDVRLLGKKIGEVRAVEFQDDPAEGVLVTCFIESDVRIPAGVTGAITQSGLVGRAHLALRPDPNAPAGEYLADGDTLDEGVVPIIGLLPPELNDRLMEAADGFAALSDLADNINDLLQPLGQQIAATGPDGEPVTQTRIAHTFEQLDRSLTGLAEIVGDRDNQQNLAAALENLQVAGDQAAQSFADLRRLIAQAEQTRGQLDQTLQSTANLAEAAQADMHELTRRLVLQADRLGELLVNVNRAATQAAEGEGTIGRLMNDPRLYNNMVDSAERLTRTLEELEDTLRTWREDGVPLRLR